MTLTSKKSEVTFSLFFHLRCGVGLVVSRPTRLEKRRSEGSDTETEASIRVPTL